MFTEEPRGLAIINNLNTNAFGSVTTQLAWLFGSVLLTIGDYQLLMGATEQHRQAGIFLAGILVGAWTGKTIVGAVDSNNKRKAAPPYATVLKAEAEGKVAGAAVAALAAEKVKDAAVARQSGMFERPPTSEHQAQQPPEGSVPPPPVQSREAHDADV